MVRPLTDGSGTGDESDLKKWQKKPVERGASTNEKKNIFFSRLNGTIQLEKLKTGFNALFGWSCDQGILFCDWMSVSYGAMEIIHFIAP